MALFDAQIADNVSYCLYLALLNVPGENVHYLELKRVEKLANIVQTGRLATRFAICGGAYTLPIICLVCMTSRMACLTGKLS